jgi:hypothetical protein
MRTLFLVVIAIVLLAISFAAFFPNIAAAMYIAFDNQFWYSPSAGRNPTGQSACQFSRYFFWIVGAVSFTAALGLFVKVVRR